MGETGKSAEHLEIIDQQLTESDEVIAKLLEITKEKALQLSDEDLKGLCVEALSVLGFSDKLDSPSNQIQMILRYPWTKPYLGKFY